MNARSTLEEHERAALPARGYLREDVSEEMQHLASRHGPREVPRQRTGWHERRWQSR